MDTITEAIGGLRTGRVYARRFGESGDWGWSYDAFTGMGFHVLRNGSGWVTGDGLPPQPVAAGDVVLVPHGAVHGFSRRPRPLRDIPRWPMDRVPSPPHGDDAEVLCGAYRLGHGRLHPFLRTLPALLVIPGEGAEQVLLDLLSDDVDQRRPGLATTQAALVDLMLVTLLRRWQERHGAAGRAAAADPAIAAALSAIHDAPAAGWSVVRLSEVAGMSRTTFTHRFTALVGRTPMAYVTGWRLTLAARLLRETRAPLASIAREVGYATEFAFAGAFRREYGIAPGRFRREPAAHQEPTAP